VTADVDGEARIARRVRATDPCNRPDVVIDADGSATLNRGATA